MKRLITYPAFSILGYELYMNFGHWSNMQFINPISVLVLGATAFAFAVGIAVPEYMKKLDAELAEEEKQQH